MAKATKTFKIGEYCKGGIITAEVNGKVITIIGKEWDMSKGTKRSSDQSGAKEFTRYSVSATDRESYRKLFMFISDLTTAYHTDKVIDWIKTKVTLTAY